MLAAALFLLLLLPLLAHCGDLYPEIAPFSQGHLQVSSLHSLYYEESGNPSGVPVLYLHGGPGSNTSPQGRRYFDPSFYRIVLFDQRGCGQSLPAGELRENDTWELLRDIEKLRVFLGLQKVLVFGGSWGSTLALLYAQYHPDRVLALVLRGIYTHRRGEAEWLFERGGASFLFPDRWEEYESLIPEEERSDMISAYYRRLNSSDPQASLQAARGFWTWECSISKLRPDLQGCLDTPDEVAYQKGSIELHYFYHDLFLQGYDILANVGPIRHIPATVVHGRYDVVCPLENAWELLKVWPKAEFHVAPTSGHSQTEEEITSLLVDATDKYRELLRPNAQPGADPLVRL